MMGSEYDYSLVFVDKTPSECAFSYILEKVPNWPDLVIALGVPIDKIKFLLKNSSIGGYEALKLWQSKHKTITKGYPPTWEFLLKAINDYISPRVSNEIAERATLEEAWSIQ